MFKLHELINDRPTWFTTERFPFKSRILESLFVHIHLWSLRKIENDSIEDIEKQQLKRLRQLIHHAYKTVPFWKRYMDNIGVRPEDIQKLQDISKIPSTSKLMVKTIPKENFISSFTSKKRRHKIVTSGTTGIPTQIYTDTFTKERRMAIRLRGFCWIVGTRKKKDVYIRIAKVNTFYPGFLLIDNIEFEPLDKIKNRLYELCGNNQCVITSYASFMTHLAELIQKENKTLPLKGVVLSGETPSLQQKQLLSKTFRCSIGSRYTSSEGGGTLAHTCLSGEYHVNFDQCLIELVPIQQEDQTDQTFGKILITDLNNYVMPFIRYEIGDIGRFLSSKCKCGNIFPTIEFLGRTVAVTNLPNGKKLHAFSLIQILSSKRNWILRYQIIRRSIYIFEILLVVTPRYSVKSTEEIKQQMENVLGTDINVVIKIVSDIKTPPGKKFLPFISHVREDRVLET